MAMRGKAILPFLVQPQTLKNKIEMEAFTEASLNNTTACTTTNTTSSKVLNSSDATGSSPRRSEKKNPPPPTNPAHIAIAALLFMPFLLTVPTTAWYYAFVCVLHLGCLIVIEGADALGAVKMPRNCLSLVEVLRRCVQGKTIGLDRWRIVFVPALKPHQS